MEQPQTTDKDTEITALRELVTAQAKLLKKCEYTMAIMNQEIVKITQDLKDLGVL